MDKLLSASPRASRQVITGYDIAPRKLPDNEHVWYAVENVAAIADAVTRDLSNVLPQSADLFSKNDQQFQKSLEPIRARIAQIAARWSGTPIGLTETIFLYQANPLGLKVLTPFEFQKAIAEGNDPPADTVVEAENQIKGKMIRILVYNEQTISDITTKAQDDAGAAGAVLLGIEPVYGLFAITLLAALAMGLLGRDLRERDVTVGVIMTFTLGLGFLFLALYSGYAARVYGILFGSILGISAAAARLSVVAALASLAILAFLYRPLLFSTFDPELARARGVPVLFLSVAFLVLLGVIVSIAVQLMGALLLFTLMVGPAATATRIVKRPVAAIALSVILGLL